ncbi:hypothetical protein ACN47E_008803 [Coniothyrium glycines]
MSSTSSSFHIPFPKTFLTVNARTKKAAPIVQSPTQSEFISHGFLSNQPISARHQSISSVTSVASVAQSEASTISPPSSPNTRAADSPVLGPKIFAPLAVNTKHALPPSSTSEMSAAERQRRLSFERHTFLSNKH